ncbi:MAG: hemerythrin domain-containing protein [Leptospiraceae bacterium]|nr:hemerythrin domain-containing protein [Leptospiraceae bacterium]MDW8306216.1 hemerythrin domain-containing protein [Leptospiraceae bacterium]
MESPNLVQEVRDWWSRTNAYLAIPYLDTQHLWLARLILQMEHALKQAQDEDFQKLYLEFLGQAKRYAQRHFRVEEELMGKFHYPALSSHQKRHQNFIAALDNLSQRNFRKENIFVLYRFLRQWITTHILKEDRHFASFFARRRLSINEFFEWYSRKEGNELSREEKEFYREVLGDMHHIVDLKPERVEEVRKIFTSLRLELKVPIIDIQHLWLIKLVVDLDYSLKERGQVRNELFSAILMDLFRYVKEHFYAEECLMEALSYEAFKEHQDKHRQFVKNLEIQYKIFGDALQERLGVTLLKDLRSWLYTHIALDDRRLGRYIQEHREKSALVSKKLLQDKKITLRPAQIALYKAVKEQLALPKT